MDSELYALGEEVGAALKNGNLVLTTAESCTGGWIGEVVTMISGSSAWYDRGFITYTNAAKQQMLGVKAATLREHGAVSEAVVREMAAGALAASGAQIAVSVSGVAGPTGGTPDKPVGTVCIGWARKGGAAGAAAGVDTHAETCRFQGDREAVRRQSVVRALRRVLEIADGHQAA
jgi:nicotinamide-nucleotide amidase